MMQNVTNQMVINNTTPKSSGSIEKVTQHIKDSNELKVQSKQELSEQDIQVLVKYTNDQLKEHKVELAYEKHEKLNEYIIKLVDTNTKEVIREIPSKKMLDYAAGMQELLGLLVDKNA